MSEGPIAVEYIEIRPEPGAAPKFERDVRKMAEPAARGLSGTLSGAVREGLKTPAGAAGAGAAIGTIVGTGIGRGIAAAMRGVTLLPRTGFQEVKDYQAGLAQLSAGIKSTGGAAGLTAKQMEDLAGSVQKYSGQTDDSIVRAESFLLTFDKVKDSVGAGNDVFTRATRAAADLAARFGGEASDKAIMLGKALQDPARGLTALSRSGIQFNDAQTKTIRQLDATGHSLDAQKIILAEVEKQVGGSAKAYGETLPGQIDRGKRAFEDISQTIVGATASFVAHNQKTTVALVGVVGGVYTAHKAVTAYRALQDTLFGSTAKKVAANALLAKSYDGVATSAGRAAGAETAAAGAGGLGGKAGAGGILARVGGLGPAAIGAAAIGTALAGLNAIGTVKRSQEVERVQKRLEQLGASRKQVDEYELSLRERLFGFDKDHLKHGQELVKTLEGRAAVARREVTVGSYQSSLEQDLARGRAGIAGLQQNRRTGGTLDRSGGVFGGGFDELQSRLTGDPVPLRDRLADARRNEQEARQALAEAGRGGRGAGRGALAGAEASVLAARDAVNKRGGNSAAEALRLEAAEARLADLRSRGGADTDKIRAAEERLTEARKRTKDVTKDLRDAEKPKALGAGDIVKRLTDQTKNAQTLVADSGLLIKQGVSEPLLRALQDIEKSAPGSFDRLAKEMTPALAKSLNTQYAELTKAQFQFYDAPRVAAIRLAEAALGKDEARLAAAQAAAYQTALRAAFLDQHPDVTRPGAGIDPTNNHGTARAGSRTTQFILNGPIVASDPAQLHRELANRGALAALGTP
jgi:hypothetical protein